MLSLLRALLPGLLLAAATTALARGGGGESYDPGRPGGGDGDGAGEILYWVVMLTIRYPQVMIPLLIVGGIFWFFHHRKHGATPRTQRAFADYEAQQRTAVSSRETDAWIGALKAKDPAFEVIPLLDKAKRIFLALQEGWFRRDLTGVRPFLSDATYQRFNTQLALMGLQGVRDAVADMRVLEMQLIGLDQNAYFDTVQIRIRAQARDLDVPASATDEEALAAARRAPVEPFTEVWSFVRRPGAVTKIGEDVFQGKCPNCGAPFAGGASNSCQYCGAVVNSGNYDWVLAEITQGIEYVRHDRRVEAPEELRQRDPAFNVQVLEDRASLVFWKWVEAQARQDPSRLAKVGDAVFVRSLAEQLSALKAQGRRRVFLDCAVGAVHTRGVTTNGEDRADVELRWSARTGTIAEDARRPQLPSAPQRWVFTLTRKPGAKTIPEHGMATFRCHVCNAPLTESASPACDYCGAPQSDGERDWVLRDARPVEAWTADRIVPPAYSTLPPPPPPPPGAQGLAVDQVLDRDERERLLYMMAALAVADGDIDAKERKLLQVCSEKWSVPWTNVELALNAGPQLYDRLVQKRSTEAEVFLRTIVNMARVDGKVDRKERKMLEAAAHHLGVEDRLGAMLKS